MTGKMLGSGLGVIAMLVTLIWALGLGLDITAALWRALLALGAMFLLGLMLGKAISDAVADQPPAPEGKSEKKEPISRKSP